MSAASSALSTPLPPAKCLLVDDLEENLLALAALLQHEDVEVLTARSGTEALELLLAHDVALAFVDVQMPEMDGFELAELIRGSERTRHVPLIFVTAGARDQHRLFRGYETGAVDFLYKPIDPHILRNKARVFFQLHRQKRQLAEQLRISTETLRLNELFVAMLGHDLRNPLTAINATANLLQRRSSDAEVQRAATRVLSGGKRMGRMIDSMLDLASTRLGGGIVIQRVPTDLGALLQAVIQEHQAALPDRRIDMLQEGDLRGTWDPDRLAQVLSNLLGNALSHGEPDQAVELHLDGSADDSVAFSISNAGSIPPELLPHIFDPFRGERHTRVSGGGLGLGLYIVQAIVVAHRGSISVDAAPDRRTTFRLELPRAPGADAAPQR